MSNVQYFICCCKLFIQEVKKRSLDEEDFSQNLLTNINPLNSSRNPATSVGRCDFQFNDALIILLFPNSIERRKRKSFEISFHVLLHMRDTRCTFVLIVFSSIQTNEALYQQHSPIFRRFIHDDSSAEDVSLHYSITTEPARFFQNEPIPLASSIVDDLTTLASAIYIISLFIIVFIFLAWITHYNAPCSSMITSILSTITGLPEPIIHSVALCGSCCVWCETTWLFRRIHRFNQWISNKIKQFFSVTCKVLYDTICPCCRPPDTPSNRSIIGIRQIDPQLILFYLYSIRFITS